MSENIIPIILTVSAFLVIIAAVHHYSRNLIIPGVTIMLAIGAISALIPTPGFELEEVYDFVENEMSEIILLIIIPVLIFESGRKLKLVDIKKEVAHIGFFAVIGVIFTIFLIGFFIGFAFDVPFIHALLFGTILAATDPVAVGAIFKKFPIPHRLHVMLEGESLFNDATGVISFNVVKAIIFAGVAFSLLDTTVSFLWSMGGAIILGSITGWATGKVLNRWNDDEHVDFTTTLAIAIGSYVVGEHFLHVSGVVTTLFVALLILRTHKDIVSEIRTLFHKYWDYVGFITNSILFFLIGIPLFYLETDVPWIMIVSIPIAILLVSRAIVVYGGNGFLRLFRIKIPIQWQHILTLGGIRGGISVALVLSLPAAYEFKDLFVTLVVSLIAINLVLNPIFLSKYMKKSKMSLQ